MAALDGLRVVDMSRHLPGPLCTMMLGDLGADVIKVELGPRGDPMRWRRGVNQANVGFALVNRNKRSVALNLARADAREVLGRLAASADVFVESFRPGVAASMGVAYEQLRDSSPRLIYCSLTGYGQTGPDRHKPGHDLNFLAQSGILGATRDGQGRPVLPGAAVADVGGGAMAATVAILAALAFRARSGLGQHLDVSILDALLPMMYFRWAAHVNGDSAPLHTGAYACYNVYRTADGRYIAIGMVEEKFWEAFCERIGRPEWCGLQTVLGAQERLRDELQAIIKQRTREEWVEAMRDLDVCFSPVLEFEEMLDDPHLRSRGTVVDAEDEQGFRVVAPGFPFQLSRTPAAIRRSAPKLGAHTREVLLELGYGVPDIDAVVGEDVGLHAQPPPG